MPHTKETLDEMLSALEQRLPGLITEYPEDGDFWMAFAGEADQIVDYAGEHSEHVSSRINCMLGSAGLIPSDNEGEPCDDA